MQKIEYKEREMSIQKAREGKDGGSVEGAVLILLCHNDKDCGV